MSITISTRLSFNHESIIFASSVHMPPGKACIVTEHVWVF